MTSAKRTEPLPCPFCASTDIDVRTGSTFRWRYVQCMGCGAHAGEIRIQTLGDGTSVEWETDAREKAIAAWNERTK